MASLSSVSSSNSLGNTSLRGFGGMASGIDRDAIIEQMTLGTNTKIESLKSNMTKLQWKQETYRGITDQILDLTDKYASYSSTSNLKDSSIFSKSLITVHGAESATRFVTATGTSKLVDSIAINAVKRLATATVRQSKRHDAGELKTGAIDLNGGKTVDTRLADTTLQLGYYDDYNKKFVQVGGEFTFESSYTFSDGTKLEKKDYLTANADGTTDKDKAKALVEKLNQLANEKGHSISFGYDEEKDQIKITKLGNGSDGINSINVNSSALSALGYSGGSTKSVSMTDFNTGVSGKEFSKSIMSETSMIDGLVGKSLIFEYNGNQKSIQLLTREEAEDLKQLLKEEDEKGNPITEEGQFNAFKNLIQERLDKAFGKGAITVNQEAVTGEDGKNAGYQLKFSTRDDSAVAILSNDDALLDRLELDFGESNRVNVDGKLDQAALELDANTYTNKNGQLDLKINGVSITGLTANSTISDILSKINSTTAAGVKATYVEATGQFMLVSNETGAGREISLDSALSKELFGGYTTGENGNLVDKNGNALTKVEDDTGKLYIDVDGGGRQYVDEHGRYLWGNGDNKNLFVGIDKDKNKILVNAAGNRVDKTGHLVDEKGQWVDKNGNLVDDKNRLIVVVDATGKLADRNEYELVEGKLTQESLDKKYEAKLINAEGHFINEDNKLVDIHGRLVDEEGYLIDRSGRRIKVNDNEFLVDEDGDYLDKEGNKIKQGDDGGWYRIDEKGNYLDASGKPVQKDSDKWYRTDAAGNFLDKDGKTLMLRAGDGNWYLSDGKNHFIDSSGSSIQKKDGKWYKVSADDGAFLDKDNNKVKKDTDGKWYQLDESGNFKQDEDGNKIEAVGGEPAAGGKPVQGERIEVAEGAEKSDGNVKFDANKAQKQEDGTIKTNTIKLTDGPITTGLVNTNVEKIKNVAENISWGQNALIQVSYGNGVTVDMERSSNTFNLEGLTVTVTGTFGGKYDGKVDENGYRVNNDGKWIDENGNEIAEGGKPVSGWVEDTSQTVTFSAKADVDKALETVKAFFEDFNALVTEINGQITARPDSAYGPLTSAQKAEMDETSIENWEKKAKQGILFGDDVMRDLSGSMEGILAKLMSYGINYQDLEKIGISYSEDYLDGGTLVFDESKFRSTMESDPDLVSKLISGGENGGKGLIHVVEDAVTPYATRYASKNGNSYGRLVEVAGTEKKPTTLMSNQIYKQLKEMQENIDKLQSQLKIEQDRYISQFTTMESLLNQMNTQSSYLSQLTA